MTDVRRQAWRRNLDACRVLIGGQASRASRHHLLAAMDEASRRVDECAALRADVERLQQEITHLRGALSALQAERDAELKWTIENLHRLYREIGTVRTVLQRKMDPTTNERAQIATLEQWASRLASMRDVLSPPSSDQETPR